MHIVRICTAIIVLLIGMTFLFEGTYPAVSEISDVIYIVVGAGLVLGYFPLIGDTLELRLRARRDVVFMPVLLVLGLLMLYYGATEPGLATIWLRSTLIVPGVLLVAISSILLVGTSRLRRRL